MADLLLELFSEEIPARMQRGAARHLQTLLIGDIQAAGFGELSSWPCKTFVTPCRLAISIQNLPEILPDSILEIKGPRVNAPEAAISGFLKKNNIEREQLRNEEGVYYATIRRKGCQTIEILKPLIENVLKIFPWPKSMRWGSGDALWVRPLHSILCIFDETIISVEFAGVKAGNITYGHRFLSPEKIMIKNAKDYEKLLEKAYVVADAEKRKNLIRTEVEKIAKAKGLSIKQDEGLLEEVTGLVEWPVALMGNIDESYMSLPPEVLISEMKNHQRYFALLHKDGSLAPRFLMVANMVASDGGKAIIAGNERVLRARLADGKFFWEQDQKVKLEDWAKKLGEVTFHAKLGTMGDKTKRVAKVCECLIHDAKEADHKKLMRAAELCKADLMTGMVGEFPELQGIMGSYYAKHQQEDMEVAHAIREHYQPQGPNDSTPSTLTGTVLSLADKLDTLCGMFIVGEKPTGSKDPFALRRAALAIIRIILEKKMRIRLSRVLVFACTEHSNEYRKKTESEKSEAFQSHIKELLDFFSDRLVVQLKDSGIRHDVIRAVIATGDDDLWRITERAKALQKFLASDDGVNLLIAYKRAANILSIEEKKDKIPYQANAIQADRLGEQEAEKLYEILGDRMFRINMLGAQEKFVESMSLFSELRAPIDQFFDKVMVNCANKDWRANRLRLLASIRDSMNHIANFSLIEGGDEVKKAA